KVIDMSMTTLRADGCQAEVTAYVGLGANLGDAADRLRKAIAQMQERLAMHVDAVAASYRTEPGDATGPDYIKTVVRLHTTLLPLELLDVLQGLEDRHGRERPYRNAPRTLDLDLLLYADQTICDERLIVPHPRMHER